MQFRKFSYTSLLVLALGIGLLAQEKPAHQSAESTTERPNIAVMELEGNGVSPTDIAGLSNRLRSELFKTGKFNVIERSRMNEILKEQGFQQTGCTNTECAVEIGQLIGVEKIVLGNVDLVAGMYAVNIRMVDVATGRIVLDITEDCEGTLRNVLKTNIRNAARKIAGIDVTKSADRTATDSIEPQRPVPQKPAGKPEDKFHKKKTRKWKIVLNPTTASKAYGINVGLSFPRKHCLSAVFLRSKHRNYAYGDDPLLARLLQNTSLQRPPPDIEHIRNLISVNYYYDIPLYPRIIFLSPGIGFTIASRFIKAPLIKLQSEAAFLLIPKARLSIGYKSIFACIDMHMYVYKKQFSPANNMRSTFYANTGLLLLF